MSAQLQNIRDSLNKEMTTLYYLKNKSEGKVETILDSVTKLVNMLDSRITAIETKQKELERKNL